MGDMGALIMTHKPCRGIPRTPALALFWNYGVVAQALISRRVPCAVTAHGGSNPFTQCSDCVYVCVCLNHGPRGGS